MTQPNDDRTADLPRRERQILELAAQGSTDKEIARDLGISTETVNTYWRRIRLRFGAASRTEVVALAFRREADRRIAEAQRIQDDLQGEIEERDRIAAKLLESEERWRSLVEGCPDAVLTIDLQGRVTFGNDTAAALGSALADVATERWRPLIQETIRHSFRTESPGSVEFERTDGSWSAAQIGPVASSQPPEAVVVLRDTTERRNAETVAARQQQVSTSLALCLAEALIEDGVNDAQASDVLHTYAEWLAADSACVCLVTERGSLAPIWAWRRDDTNTERAEVTIEGHPMFEEKADPMATAYVCDREELPSGSLLEEMRASGVRGRLCVPLASEGNWIGVLGFETEGNPLECDARELLAVRQVASALAFLLTRKTRSEAA